MKKIITMLATAALASMMARADSYQLRIGEVVAEPGHIAQAAVYLDQAADVASIEFQINYDAYQLFPSGVTNPAGSLGEAFGIDSESDDGIVIVRLYRQDGLLSGTGVLAYINFEVNEGAQPGMGSDLTVASCGLGDEFGGDLRWKNSIAPQNGKFWVAYSSTNDTDGDGLSDYEEQMLNGSGDYDPGGTDSDINKMDTDGDGMPDGWEVSSGLDALVSDAVLDNDGDGLNNGLEYQYNMNPLVMDTDSDGYDDWSEYVAGTDGNDENDCFLANIDNGFLEGPEALIYWNSVSGRLYSILTSTNLMSLWTTNPVYQLQGDGTQQRFTNTSPENPVYFRIGVRLDP